MTKKILLSFWAAIVGTLCFTSCSSDSSEDSSAQENTTESVAEENLVRAVSMMEAAIEHYFTGGTTKLLRYYNPLTNANKDNEVGSVWMYTSSIEATNAILQALTDIRSSKPELYEQYYQKYVSQLAWLYDGLEYYAGTFTHRSYTQTKEWTVYGVDRSESKGNVNVGGIGNVYDDQEWLIHELVHSYQLTSNSSYLSKAEYLTDYVLDGWDCDVDAEGNEFGGITWGPGYDTKHACSNAPIIAPLVWLHEIYKGQPDVIKYRTIQPNRQRVEVEKNKAEYYLAFAEKIYNWQKRYLLKDDGVYSDLMEVSHPYQTENVDGIEYRQGNPVTNQAGSSYTYNSGTMLSGGAELYRVTGNAEYLTDIQQLTSATFSYFAHLGEAKDGYYSYPIEGFSPWFNDVLLTGYIKTYNQYSAASAQIATFQQNLDNGWTVKQGNLLPVNLLVGWAKQPDQNNVEALFTFGYISEYAQLSSYELNKN